MIIFIFDVNSSSTWPQSRFGYFIFPPSFSKQVQRILLRIAFSNFSNFPKLRKSRSNHVFIRIQFHSSQMSNYGAVSVIQRTVIAKLLIRVNCNSNNGAVFSRRYSTQKRKFPIDRSKEDELPGELSQFSYLARNLSPTLFGIRMSF
jgi:hypothetical protein